MMYDVLAALCCSAQRSKVCLACHHSCILSEVRFNVSLSWAKRRASLASLYCCWVRFLNWVVYEMILPHRKALPASQKRFGSEMCTPFVDIYSSHAS